MFILVIMFGLFMQDAFAQYGDTTNPSSSFPAAANTEMKNTGDDLDSMRATEFKNRDNFVTALENKKRTTSDDMDKLKAQKQTRDITNEVQAKEREIKMLDTQINKASEAKEDNWVLVRDSIYKESDFGR